MQKWVALVAIAMAAGTGCTSEMDATGNWITVATYGSGSCGFTGTNPVTYTVTKAPSGYVVAATDPNIRVVATVTCSASECRLSMTEMVTSGTLTLSKATNLTLDAEDGIIGSGSVTSTGGPNGSCMQTYTVVGTLQ